MKDKFQQLSNYISEGGKGNSLWKIGQWKIFDNIQDANYYKFHEVEEEEFKNILNRKDGIVIIEDGRYTDRIYMYCPKSFVCHMLNQLYSVKSLNNTGKHIELMCLDILELKRELNEN